MTGESIATPAACRSGAAAPRAALWPGLALAMAGSIAFSGKAIIVKLAYRYGVDAVTLIMYRMLFALPLFAVLAWWAGRGRPAADATRLDRLHRPRLQRLLPVELPRLCRPRVHHGEPRAAHPLPQPDARARFGAIAYKRRVRARQVIALAVSYCGVLLVFGHEVSLQGTDAALGTALVFASAISYAVYLVLAARR